MNVARLRKSGRHAAGQGLRASGHAGRSRPGALQHLQHPRQGRAEGLQPLQQFKRNGKGKIFGVLGCVAQQEGERIFERAPHVSLVCGSASYNKLGEMLVQIEAGDRRVTGLSLDTDETFDTPFTRRDNPHRAYITIIEGCDKSLRLLRGAVHARAGAQPHQRERDGRSAPPGGGRLHRNPAAGAEREQLPRSLAGGLGFRHAARARGRDSGHPPRALTPPRIRAISARTSWTPWTRTRCSATTCTCRCSRARRSVLAAMDRLYTRDEYMRRIEWLKSARRALSPSPPTSSSAFPGETEDGLRGRRSTCSTRWSTIRCSASSIRRARTRPRSRLEDRIPEEEKQRRLAIVQEKQRAIQIRRNAELIGSLQEVLVEGRNQAAGAVDRAHFGQPHAELHPRRKTARPPWSASTCPCASRAPAPTPWWARAQLWCN